MSLHLLNSIFSELKHCTAYSTRDGVTVVTPGNMHIEVVTKYFDEPLVLAALEAITAALRERVENAGQPLKVVNIPTSAGIQWEFKEEQPKDVLIGKVVNLEQPAWVKAKQDAAAIRKAIGAEVKALSTDNTEAPAKRGRRKKD